MNRHDDGTGQDHGWVDPAEAGLLKQTFGAMAGGIDPASPTGPAATLTAMSRRVRRRRTAKLGGIGGGAFALAGALVLGAGQLAPPEQEVLLPGAPASTAEFELRDGYQPPWLDWSDLTCGMPVADLESTAPGWSVEAAGDLYARTADLGGEPTTSWGMASTLHEGQGALDAAPVLVWSRDGVVLDLGPDVFEAPGRLSAPLLGGGPDAVAAAGSSGSTCAPTSSGAEATYRAPLPEGDYEVRVVAFPQAASGDLSTVVSEPVPVRIDAEGAHGRGDPRDGGSAVEFPEPVKGEVSRFELDRGTEWTAAELTQRGYLSDTRMLITGQCAGGDPEAAFEAELVLPSTGEKIGGTTISCDGFEAGSAVEVPQSGGEAIDIRLSEVPDGVSRLWVSLQPEAPVGGEAAGECSASGFEPEFVPGSSLTGSTAATAGSIVLAATDCDTDALVAFAEDYGTELMSGAETPEQTFALPEEPGTEHYRTLAALLTGTAAAIVDEGTADATVVWPRVATEEFRDSDEAWAEVVAAGLLSAEEADAQRADGYQGPQVGMNLAGDWLYYSAGD
ncbi:hypothetical protein [Promicromonospora aerolata]|uniref:Uncharacterized protein n=1 Tax=Promicromonospora aerolata TaxID=195749 RepID=A0ABW4VB35_9MICO